MNNQLAFTGVCYIGCERVGKGRVMQCFERNQTCMIQQSVKENNV